MDANALIFYKNILPKNLKYESTSKSKLIIAIGIKFNKPSVKPVVIIR